MLIGVLFPVIIETDGEDLLLSLLHTSGDDLRSLIQQERLRWLVFCSTRPTLFYFFNCARSVLLLIISKVFVCIE